MLCHRRGGGAFAISRECGCSVAVQVHIVGDTAMLACIVHQEMTFGGKTISFDAADSSTWVRRDGGWVCALHTESMLEDPRRHDDRRRIPRVEDPQSRPRAPIDSPVTKRSPPYVTGRPRGATNFVTGESIRTTERVRACATGPTTRRDRAPRRSHAFGGRERELRRPPTGGRVSSIGA